jgi:glycosyltransferase involved in cell wall biosynthesis
VKPGVTVVADVPSPFQNVFFDAVARRDEVDLEVVFCRASVGYRSAWLGSRPRLARYEIASRIGVEDFFLNPTVVPQLLARRDRLPVIIGYYLPTMAAAVLALGAMGRRWAFWTDTIPDRRDEAPSLKSRGRNAMLRYCLTRSSVCLTTGAAGVSSLVREGADPRRIHSMPFVTDQERICADSEALRPRREIVRRDLGIPPSARVFLFVGQMIARKGVDLLIDAVAGLPRGGPVEPWLVLVGEGPDRASFEALAMQRGVGVTFVPNTPNEELPRFFAIADAFVLASRFDAWPVVVIQALAAGLPVIGSDAAGSVRDCVRDGESGWVFPTGDVAALTAALERAYRADPQLLLTMGRAATEAVRPFSPDAVAATFTRAVEHALSVGVSRSS